MRASARRIMEQFAPEALPLAAEPVEKINSLEAPHDPADDPIPASWTPEHVSKRIVEAFETLSRQPPLRGPRMPGDNWPEVLVEWEDQLAQVESDAAEKRTRARNRVKVLPSAIDLRRMETVLEWLSDLYKVDPGLCRVVQRWAKLRSARKSIKEDCRRTGLSFQVFYRQRDKGVAIIVAGLGAAPVW